MNDVNSTLPGGSLRSKRRSAGLSQAEVAERAGCSVNYVALLERGYMPRYSDVLPRLLDVLGVATTES